MKPLFGDMHLDEIGVAQIAQFRAVLVEGKQRKVKCAEMPLSDKYIDNILAVMSKALKYAEDVQMIQRAPKLGISGRSGRRSSAGTSSSTRGCSMRRRVRGRSGTRPSASPAMPGFASAKWQPLRNRLQA